MVTYDPVPDLAKLLRVLEWSVPIGDVYPGSAQDLHQQIRAGLGITGPQTALEYEAVLYRRLAELGPGKVREREPRDGRAAVRADGQAEPGP